jgi:hypothetical protein
MITLLASIAGFISSLFPEIFKIIKDKNDKNHELKILDIQMQMHKEGINSRLEEINSFADIESSKALYSTYKTGIDWVDALNGTVRPVLAYSFFILYALVKFMQFSVITSGAPMVVYTQILWTGDDQAIFAGIISFYYGQRAMAKFRGKK